MKKKGFTLAELLGVIVILLLLVLIVTPIAINYAKKTSDSVYDVQVKTIKTSAKEWASDKNNIKLLPTEDNECIEVSLEKLKEAGYLDYNIKNPKTNSKFDDDLTVIIKKEGKNLTYTFNEDGTQVCSTVITTDYPKWVFISSNPTLASSTTEVTVNIESDKKISEYNLTADNIIVKVGSTINDNANILINCNNGQKLSCTLKLNNLVGDGRLTLVIDKNVMKDEDLNPSRKTNLLTDTIVDSKGPEITYTGRTNTNASIYYATKDDTVEIKFKAEDNQNITSNLTANDIKVYLDGIEASCTKELTTSGSGNSLNYVLKLTNVTGSGKVSIKVPSGKVLDSLGNVNNEKTITPGITYDNIKPIITFEPDGETRYLQSITPIINVIDNETGVDEDTIKYIISTNSNATPNTSIGNGGEITISGLTGDYYIVGYACDYAGNCNTSSSGIYHMNNTGPSIEINPTGNSGYAKTENIKIKVTARGTALDEGSFVYAISTDINAEPNQTFTNNTSLNIPVLTGIYYINAKACDMDGNCSQAVSNKYYFDNQAPDITYNPNGTNNTYKKSETVQIKVTDNIELDWAKYIISTDKTATPNITISNGSASPNITGLTGIYYIVAKGCDKLNNCAQSNSNKYYFDNTAPSITFGTASNNSYQKFQSSKVTLLDSDIGTLQNLKYIWSETNNVSASAGTAFENATTITKNTGSGTFYLCVYGEDGLGNSNNKCTGPFKIDNGLPTASITSTNDVATSQTATLTIGDNIGVTKYYFGTKNPNNETVTWVDYSTNVMLETITDPGTYYLGVKDAAENMTVVSKTFYKTTLTPNRGSVTPTSVITMAGNSFTIPTPTAVTGYTFNGWYTATSGGTKYTSPYTPTSSVTMQGVWDTHTYTVEYYQGNNSTTAGSTKFSTTSAHTYNTAKNLTTYATLGGTAPSGWTFAGWSTSQDGTSVTYTDGQSVNNLTAANNGTIKLYAVFKRDITIVSGVNKASSTVKTQYYNPYKTDKITAISAPAPSTTSLSGWTALGYRDDTTAGGKEYGSASAGNITPAYNSGNTLYAVYSKSGVATFYSGVNKATNSAITATAYYNSNAASAPTTTTFTLQSQANSADISNWTERGWRDDTSAGDREYTYGQTGVSITLGGTLNFYSVYSRSATANFYSGVNKATNKALTPTAYYNTNTSSVPTTTTFTLQSQANSADISNWTERGWRDDTSAGDREYTYGQANVSITLGGTLNFYSVYSRTLTISYAGNGNTGGSTGNTTKAVYLNTNSTSTSSQAVTLASNGFSRTNYTFKNWTIDSTAYNAGASYNPNLAYNVGTFGKTATANWSQNCTFTSKTFTYTGGVQSWTVPTGCGGRYQLEVWGAQGGMSNGGKGGYAEGEVDLTAGTTIYIVVGGQGTQTTCNSTKINGGYNGGGYTSCDYYNGNTGTGGGATHIGTFNSTLAAHGNTSGLYIVAGGGGGGHTAAHDGNSTNAGGAGGGTTGGNGQKQTNNGGYGLGGSQTAGGGQATTSSGSQIENRASWNYGSFGQGGSQLHNTNQGAGHFNSGAGGGGGLYGGGAGLSNDGEAPSGGGGSSWVGGCIANTGSTTAGQQSGNGKAVITKK